MRTTLDIPIDLINEAMKLSGCKTKSQTIRHALMNLIQREKRRKLIGYRGKVDLNIDLDILRDRK